MTVREYTNGAIVESRPNVGRPLIMAETLRIETEQRKLLGEFVHSNMVDGLDYGIIPGTDKKSLLKPGAEKLTSLFRCAAEFEITKQIEDWDKPLFYYQFKCRIVSLDTGATVAEGVGSCNSMEAKYRWRQGERKCPACGKAAIIKGREDYGGGWLCYARKGGCGAKFGDHAPEIVGQIVGRIENDDVYTQCNTILKMAKKRAHVDASISLARCSDMFTQDVEDSMPDDSPPTPANRAEKVRQTTGIKSGSDLPTPAAKIDVLELEELLNKVGMTWTDIRSKFADREKRAMPESIGELTQADRGKLKSSLLATIQAKQTT